MKKRILYILLIILYTISISRISYLMIYKKGYYKEILKQKNNKIIYGNSAPRGRILDRSGNIIVDNVGIKTIIYNKIKNIELKDEIDIATKLSEIIGIDFGNNEETLVCNYLEFLLFRLPFSLCFHCRHVQDVYQFVQSILFDSYFDRFVK